MARSKKHIQLSDDDVKRLKGFIKSKNTHQTATNRFRVLLALDKSHPPAMSYNQCVEAYGLLQSCLLVQTKMGRMIFQTGKI